MIDLATHIIDKKKTSFDPSKFEDRYENALLELIRAKKAGRKPPAGEGRAGAVQRGQPVRRAEEEPRRRRLSPTKRRQPKTARGGKAGAARRRRPENEPEDRLWRSSNTRPSATSAKPSRKRPDVSERGEGEGGHLRRPEACGHAPALRLPTGARRRAVELGGDARAEPRPVREAAGRACGGSSARLCVLRGHHPRRANMAAARSSSGTKAPGRRRAIRLRA